MPYHIVKIGSRFKVQDDKGRYYSNKGLTKEKARLQQKALYAAERRKLKMIGAGWALSKDGQVHLVGNGWFSDALRFVKTAAIKGVRGIQNLVVRPEPIQTAADVTSQLTRQDYPPAARATLAKYNNASVVELLVRRAPIKTYVNNALNIITLGKWNSLKSKYNYDKLYHLSLVAKLALPNGDPAFVMIEKNQVISITDKIKTDDGTEYFRVPVAAGITLGEMMDKAAQAVGPSFFQYDAFKNNCQLFIKNILDANGLSTPQINGFVMQDVSSLLQGLPHFVSPFARLVTNIAGLADFAIEGRGATDSTPNYTGLYTGADGLWKVVKDGSQPTNVGFFFRVNHSEPGGGEWIWTGAPTSAPWMANWSQPQINEMLKQRNDEAKRFGPPQVNFDPRSDEQKKMEADQEAFYAEHPDANPANFKSEEDFRYGDNPLIVFSASNPGPVDTTTGAKAISARKMRDGSYEIKYDNGSVEFTPGVTDQWVNDNRGVSFDKAEYQNEVLPQRIQQLDEEIKKKQQEAWENSSGLDKFFSNVTDGLVNVADFATNLSLPGAAGVASDVYQTFRPGTREEREAEERMNAVNNYAEKEYAKEGTYVNFRNDAKYANLFKNDATLDDPRQISRSILERVSDASVFDPQHKEQQAQQSEGGSVSKPSPAFRKQLREVGILPADYLTTVRHIAKQEGYSDVLFSDDDEHKLMIYDNEGKLRRFGRVGYNDLILWTVLEMKGKARKGQAEMKRKVFHKSHSAIRGDWKSDKYSPNQLSLKILW